MKSKQNLGLGKYIYMEWLIPVKDYYCSIRKNEFVFEIIIPLLTSLICVYTYCEKRKLLIALDGLSELLPTAISILIGFTVLLITLLLTSSSNNVERLKRMETKKVLHKKTISLYQGLHIQFSHSLFSEIFLLLLVFFYLFLKGIGLPHFISIIILLAEIYLILNILLSLLRGISNVYFSFYNELEDK